MQMLCIFNKVLWFNPLTGRRGPVRNERVGFQRRAVDSQLQPAVRHVREVPGDIRPGHRGLDQE